MIFPKESLFALSLIPYLGFLWCLIRSKQAPTLAIIGFSLTLLFVAVTIPAGLFAFRAYGQTLAWRRRSFLDLGQYFCRPGL
jgi:dolichyl-phosphate-mannose--protein O-mannosyl transferase